MKLSTSIKDRLIYPIVDTDNIKASVSVVFACEKDNFFILFIKRKESENDPWSGHYAFPGGKKEKNESSLECAIRECEEEVGVVLERTSFLGCGDDLDPLMIPNFLIKPHIFMLEKRAPLINCQREVESSYWLPLSHFYESKNHQKHVFRTSIGPKELPCIKFDHHLIWGISYIILSEISKRLHDLEYLPGRSFQLLPSHFSK